MFTDHSFLFINQIILSYILSGLNKAGERTNLENETVNFQIQMQGGNREWLLKEDGRL